MISGIHVFGFDIEILHQVRTSKSTIVDNDKTIIIDKRKTISEVVSISQQNKRSASFEIDAHKLILQHRMISEFGEPIHLHAYVRACDDASLGRDGYRRLIAVEARLDKELTQQLVVDDEEFQENSGGIVVGEQDIGKENYETVAKVGRLFEYLEFMMKMVQKRPVLFPAIKQENYIPDELNLLLCISDLLMECFLMIYSKRENLNSKLKAELIP
ncbi:hypothetical protein GLOIN_2v1828103 [Rhizophagus clarus]|uniref:Uncharacterized protein n=1 Tax=Rhizophagus clarus TaxID=94130 RepID=A0A8H3MCQ0_9GLOM|nr:hypothetical protein GLOIN_2v1828103 [Rhizophagus clarus]